MKFSEIVDKGKMNVGYDSKNDFEVTGLACNSKHVKPGNIFFAIKGLKDDGNKYINDALINGAKLIFTQDSQNQDSSVPIIKVNEIRKLMARISNIFYDISSTGMRLIGVTGTNGKTTTAYLIKSLLEGAGYRVGLMGTINYEIGSTKISSTLTTPDSIEINMMLQKMANSRMDFCVMEVSSIALVLDRVYGLTFDSAVFTNLTSEHLDFHLAMENYFDAKKILFDSLEDNSNAISNIDDHYGEQIIRNTRAKTFFYSIKQKSDLKASNERLSLSGIEFDVTYDKEVYKLKSNLSGRFNIYNILASVSTVLNYNISINSIQESLLNFHDVNGRFNRVKLPNNAVAIIDYSHTSDSLKNAIESAREILTQENRNSKVITIFGCGGNKDKTKRPVMGNFATSLSDYSIITSDNPRFENPMGIINEILAGVKTKNNYEIIENREEAIKRGIEISKEGDIVLICGKGHETYQEIQGSKHHFDDKEIVGKYSGLAH